MFKFARSFHAAAARRVAVGDKVPSALLLNGGPTKTFDLAKATQKGKYLIVGVPGAFSPGCSVRHIPEYLSLYSEFKAKGIQHVYVVTVNDAFVADAWKQSLFSSTSMPGVEDFYDVLADPGADFSKQFDTVFDASQFFGGPRSKRYAALIEDGTVKKTFVESDNTGIDASAASKVKESLSGSF